MKRNTENRISHGFRLLVCVLSVFFLLLAVFDGFEEKVEIEYFGELITEGEIDFVDFPESISRPSGIRKVNKLDRVPVLKFFDRILSFLTSENVFAIKTDFKLPQIFVVYNFFISNSVCSNAP